MSVVYVNPIPQIVTSASLHVTVLSHQLKYSSIIKCQNSRQINYGRISLGYLINADTQYKSENKNPQYKFYMSKPISNISTFTFCYITS